MSHVILGHAREAEPTHELLIVLRDGSRFLQYGTWDRLIALASGFSGQYKWLKMRPVSKKEIYK